MKEVNTKWIEMHKACVKVVKELQKVLNISKLNV